MPLSYRTTSEKDTLAFAGRLAGQLKPGTSVLLEGELGAGKSVMARGIARALGVKGPMPSPSFTMMIPYHDGTVPVYHYDLYRLGSPDEFYEAGLDEDLNGDGICLIEWPQTIGLEVEPSLSIEILRGEEADSRIFRLEGNQMEIDEGPLQRWRWNA